MAPVEKVSLSGFFIQTYGKLYNYVLFVESNYDSIDSFLLKECQLINESAERDTVNFFEAIKNTINYDSLDRIKYSKKVFQFRLNKDRDIARFYSTTVKHYDSTGNLLLAYKRMKETEFSIIHGEISNAVYPRYPLYELIFKNSKYHFYCKENPPYDILIW